MCQETHSDSKTHQREGGYSATFISVYGREGTGASQSPLQYCHVQGDRLVSCERCERCEVVLTIWCRLREEMQNVSQSSLIDGGQDTVNLCLANLMLTGRATPFFHNGIISGRSQHDGQLEEMIGIIERWRFKLFSFKIHFSDLRC